MGIVCASFGSAARADSANVLVIAAGDSVEAAVTDAVRDAVAELDEVRLLPPPPLDLEAAQLALDCTDDGASCIAEVAERMDAQIVLVPELRKRADSLELHLKCFQERAPHRLSTAMRKQAGTRLDSTLLATVPSMVREVLDLKGEQGSAHEVELERVPELESSAGAVGEDEPAEEQPSETSDRSWIGPLIVGGGGLALITAGVVFGAMASASEDDYASRDIDTPEQAERAHEVRETGESQALTANVLFATGALALTAAGVWYLVDRPKEEAPQTARLTPVLGPSSAGLLLSGRWQLQP